MLPADPSQDTVTVREFSAFVLRYVADAVDDCLAMTPEAGLVKTFWGNVVELDSVDDNMIEFATQLTRTKALFRATDADQSGSVSRDELLKSLRRYGLDVGGSISRS